MASTAELLLTLASTPAGQALLLDLVQRPDTPQAEIEMRLKQLKTAEWPNEPVAPEAPKEK